MRLGILAFDGFDELDVVGPLEVFRRAASKGADLATELLTLMPRLTIRGAYGLTIEPDGTYESGTLDAVLVVGGSWVQRSDVGAWGEYQRGDILAVLKAEADRGTLMLGVCTGTMLLAHAGVVRDRPAATHNCAWDDLVSTGATLITKRVVDDGNLITCGGVTSGIDLALHVVAREFSEDLSNEVSADIEY